MIEKGASDDRNFVKKGVSWALRASATARGASCGRREDGDETVEER